MFKFIPSQEIKVEIKKSKQFISVELCNRQKISRQTLWGKSVSGTYALFKKGNGLPHFCYNL